MPCYFHDSLRGSQSYDRRYNGVDKRESTATASLARNLDQLNVGTMGTDKSSFIVPKAYVNEFDL